MKLKRYPYIMRAPISQLEMYYPQEYAMIKQKMDENGYNINEHTVTVNGSIFYCKEHPDYPTLYRFYHGWVNNYYTTDVSREQEQVDLEDIELPHVLIPRDEPLVVLGGTPSYCSDVIVVDGEITKWMPYNYRKTS